MNKSLHKVIERCKTKRNNFINVLITYGIYDGFERVDSTRYMGSSRHVMSFNSKVSVPTKSRTHHILGILSLIKKCVYEDKLLVLNNLMIDHGYQTDVNHQTSCYLQNECWDWKSNLCPSTSTGSQVQLTTPRPLSLTLCYLNETYNIFCSPALHSS